jgi:hypothetical protein
LISYSSILLFVPGVLYGISQKQSSYSSGGNAVRMSEKWYRGKRLLAEESYQDLLYL